MLAAQKNKVSYAYWSIWTVTFLYPTSMLSNKLLSTTFLETPSSPLDALRKKNGVKGSPCLKPFFGVNSLVGIPFTSIDTVTDSKQDLIQKIHFSQNLNLSIM